MTADAPGGRREDADRSPADSTTDVADDGGTEWQWVDPDGTDRAAGDDRTAERDRRTDDDRIPLDLSSGPTETDSADDPDEDDPYAPEPSSAPIERGEPSVEHSMFVVLGALAMILVIVRLVSIPL